MYGSNQLSPCNWKSPWLFLGNGTVELCLSRIDTLRECTVLLPLQLVLDQIARGNIQIDIPSPEPHIRLHFRRAEPRDLGSLAKPCC